MTETCWMQRFEARCDECGLVLHGTFIYFGDKELPAPTCQANHEPRVCRVQLTKRVRHVPNEGG